MQLDRLSLALRPRNAWEGMDLGFVMAREWFLPLWRLWVLAVLPTYLLLLLLFPDNNLLIAILLWWLKPLFEPPLVYWLSRAIFGERPTLAAIIQRWFALVWPQLLHNLTWRRFSPNRSFFMPIAVLEQLSGKSRRDRIRVLGRKQQAGIWLTIVGIHFEIALELSVLVLIVIMLPEELQWLDLKELVMTPNYLGEVLQQFSGILAMSLIAPFYVAGGFALYLTRRSELEAWDIEISFRRLAERMTSNKGAGAGSLLTLFFALLIPIPEASAAVDRQQAKEQIQLVLAQEDFGKPITQSYWKYIKKPDRSEQERDLPRFLDWLVELFTGFTRGIAAVGELLLWLLAAGIGGYLIYWLLHSKGFRSNLQQERKGERQKIPHTLFGLHLRSENLPHDIPAEALNLLHKGASRAALSLLYRGALAALIKHQNLKIPDSATEEECLALVAAVRSESETEYFARLTNLWLRLAYGHQPLAEEVSEQLCVQWQAHFGEADEPA